MPTSGLLGVGFLTLCATPVATGAPWLALLYVVPVALAWWILRTRTVVDSERLVTRQVFSSRTIPWSRITSLKLSRRSWVSAVLDDGQTVQLPAIRLRHLPMLAALSGGRLSDPTADSAE